MEASRLYKQRLPLARGQVIKSIIYISVHQIPIEEWYCLEEGQGINYDRVDHRFIENRCRKNAFDFWYT